MPRLSGKVPPLLLVSMFSGCASPDFNRDAAKVVLEANPVQLNAEQLLLTEEHVACGDREELWRVSPLGAGRAIGRLSDRGRALQFSDDVRVGDTGSPGPTVQVTGTFALRALQVASLHDEDPRTKVVEARTAVVVKHACFAENLPMLLGVRKGEFTASANPMFRLRLREHWTVEAVLH